jgi:hypothetical protein
MAVHTLKQTVIIISDYISSFLIQNEKLLVNMNTEFHYSSARELCQHVVTFISWMNNCTIVTKLPFSFFATGELSVYSESEGPLKTPPF